MVGFSKIAIFQVRYLQKFLLWKSGGALVQTAQGGAGGVTVPGGDPELWRCDTQGRGPEQSHTWVDGWIR